MAVVPAEVLSVASSTANGYRGEVADLAALYSWEADNPAEPPLQIGDWLWVLSGGEVSAGAYKQVRRLPATNGAAWSGWYGDLLAIPAFDSTITAWSSSLLTFDQSN